MITLEFSPDAENELPARLNAFSDLSTEHEIDLRYDFFSCRVSLSINEETFLGDSYVPLLDFTMSLSYMLHTLHDSGKGSITFTENSNEINFRKTGSTIHAADNSGCAANCTFDELVQTSRDFSFRALDYLFSRYPTLRNHPSLTALQESIRTFAN
ncbi:hypothetical protein [Streptomyces sp. NPDC051211]|uniref:hypothetical protein n=1 Tax=Streptomyces sp. NPDC051211 TaxID=3154643 RepID=UPI003450F41E